MSKLIIRFILFSAVIFSLLVSRPAVRAQSTPNAIPGKVRVVTKPLEPFVIFPEDGKLTGFSVELWDAIAQTLGLDYEWTRVTKVTEQLEAIQNGQADVAIAGISMTPEREQVIDFTHPYFDAGLRILTSAKPGTASVTDLIGTIFSPSLLKVLGFGLLTLLVMAHIIWLVERGSKEDMPKAYFPGIWEGIWWSLSTISTLEYGDKEKPRNIWKRLLAMLLVVIGIILIAQFTAAITASLTVQQLTGTIKGPADLPGKQITTVNGSTAAQYLKDQGLGFSSVDRVEEAYALLEAGKTDAVVYDSPVLLYYANNQGKGKVQIAGPIFKEETYGIALPSGSPLREPINEALLRLKQNGTYTRIYQKWFGDSK